MAQWTKAAGPADLSVCEAEPIRTPGSTQAYGCLLTLRAADGALVGHSGNAAVMLGRDLAVGQSIDDALGRAIWPILQAALAKRLPQADPEAVDLTEAAPGLQARFDVVAHRSGPWIVVEFLPRRPQTPGLEAAASSAGFADDAADLFRLSQGAAERIRVLTGSDRVMIYRFHEDWTGEVIAEVRRADMTPYLGLRYPASDIPSQARQLFRETLIRQIADVEAPEAGLVMSDTPLDLSKAILRSASPYHMGYLRNMGVAATLTLSIVVDGKLWGLVGCHHTAPRYIGFEQQRAALALTRRFATRIEALEGAEARVQGAFLDAASDRWRTRFAGIRGVVPLPRGVIPLVTHLGALAGDLRADGLAIVCGDTCLSLGAAPDCEWLIHAASQLRDRATLPNVLATDWLGAEPGLLPSPAPLAGAMVAVVSGLPTLALYAFRTALVREVHWGGDPSQPALVSPDDGRLSPRRSFERWRELVRDQARPWTQAERELFTLCASQLDVGLAADPERFATALSEDLAAFAESYTTVGDAQRLFVDVLPENMGVLLWETGRQGAKLLHVNRAFTDMFGVEPSELVGGDPERAIDRARLDRAALHIDVGAEQEFDAWSPTKGARRLRTRRERLVRYRGAEGVRMVESMILSDVTGDFRAHEALIAAVRRAEVAESARSALLRNMSHELRTPLNAVLGYSDLLAKELLGPLGAPAYVEAAGEIRASAGHLLSLIDQTLEMARLREGQLSLSEVRLDLRGPIDEAVNMVQLQADAGGITLQLSTPDLALVGTADQLAVRQMAINLISNAIKFTPRGGAVAVGLERLHDGDVALTVTDTGIGIPFDAVGKLFQPFSQVDSSLGRRQGGSGLGLSIVKSLAQLHGGSVGLESAEGRGSTFTVRLPAWRMEAAA